MTEKETIKILKSWRDPKNKAGMVRFGINERGTLGIPVPKLRALSKKIGRDHALALRLWRAGIHEAQLLAAMICEPEKMTAAQADSWAKSVDSWDTCDQAAMNAWRWAPFAWKKVFEWPKSGKEFVRRSGFSLMAALAVGDPSTRLGAGKAASDAKFIALFPLIKRYSVDERNFVRKAVNWALRQIGKRNLKLNKAAIKAAKDIAKIDTKAARWIAADAIRELSDPKIISRLKK
jgi:3-methyladenine DNA glycosylase AlkD